MKILLLTNGREGQTTAILFRALARKLSERHSVDLRLRPPPPGVLGLLRRMLLPSRDQIRAVRDCDVLILHTAVAFRLVDGLIARLLGKRILVFYWDVYPDSMSHSDSPRTSLLTTAFGFAERAVLRRADAILIPIEDYRLHPAVAALRKVSVFPMWPTSETVLPPRQRTEGSGATRIAFSGQVNKIRDLDSACQLLCRRFEGPLELHIYSTDRFEPDAATRSLIPGRLSIIHHGFLPEDELAVELNSMDAGLISLAPDFPLPAFPSKLFAYVQAGVPVVYHGPQNRGIKALLAQSGVGFPLADTEAGSANEHLIAIARDYEARRLRFIDAVRLEWHRLAEIL